MAYIAAILGILGAVGSSVGGAAITANNSPQPTGVSDIQRLLGTESQFKPAAYSSGLANLESQNAYGTGASPDQMALELITRQIEQASNPNVARKFQKYYSNLQSYSLQMQQGGSLSVKDRKLYEIAKDKAQRILAARGGGATLSFDGGRPTLTFADPAQQQMIETARQNFSGIQANRLAGQQQLSNLAGNYPVATAQNIQNWQDQYAKQITGEINNTYDQQTNDLLQLANTRGFNPAGSVGLLDQQKSRDLLAVPQSAAARAFQLIGGQQGLANNSIAGINAALSPDATIAIMNALRGQQTPTTGQLAAAQIGANTSLQNTGSSNLSGSVNSSAGDLSRIFGLLTDYGLANALPKTTTSNPNSTSTSSTSFGPGAP